MKYVLATLLIALIASGETVLVFAPGDVSDGGCACGADCRCGPGSSCGSPESDCFRLPERTPAPAKLAPATGDSVSHRTAVTYVQRHDAAVLSRRAAVALRPARLDVRHRPGAPPGDRSLYLLDSALLL